MAALGAQIFTVGAFVVTLIYLAAKILIDFRHLNLYVLLIFVYCMLPISGAFGAILAFRACRMAVTRKVPEMKAWAWIVAIFVVSWTVILIFFSQKMRQAVLEKGERRLTSAFVYFGLTVLIIVPAAFIPDDASIGVLFYAVMAMWFCCDTLLINVLGTLRDKHELAPLPSEKFQFSLGTLFLVVFCSAAWVTGLIKLLQR